MNVQSLVTLLTLAAVLQGCTLLDGARAPLSKRVDRQSTYPVVPRDQIETINIFKMLDPEDTARSAYETRRSQSGAAVSPAWTALPDSDKYDLAFKAFYSYHAGKTPDGIKLERNRIQDRVLAASVARCNVYKVYLQRDQSDTNFTMGSGATIAGVLGAVLPGVQSARNLAGVAGLFSGIRAEFNQSYYSNLAAHVVVRGIETAQGEAYARIQTQAQSRPINEYTVEAALKDAIYFDGLCSAITGLEQAADSIRTYADPGLDSIKRATIKAREIQLLAKEDIKTLDDLRKYDGDPNGLKLSIIGIPVTRPVSTSTQGPGSAITIVLLAKSRLEREQLVKAAAFNQKYRAAKKDDKLDVSQAVSKGFQAQQKPLTDALLACVTSDAQQADQKVAAASTKLRAARESGVQYRVEEAEFAIAESGARIIGIKGENAVDAAVADLSAVLAAVTDAELTGADLSKDGAVTTLLSAKFKGKTASANTTPCK